MQHAHVTSARFALLPLVLLVSGCLGPWPGGPSTDDDDDSVGPAIEDASLGFVYSSSQNDGGWAQTHHQAALAVAEELDIPLSYRPAVASADVGAEIDSLIEDDGANIIYTTSSGYINATLQAANDHPDVSFFSCCGKATDENLTSYFGRMYQPIYLAGYLAGSMTCTEQLGVVAALPLSQFVRHINAFTLGAKAANPNVVVDVRWVGAFFDPSVEEAKALELIDAGADVILAQSNSTAPLQARSGEMTSCESGGETTDVDIWRVGYHSPTACSANPEQCLTAAHWQWEALYERQVRSLFDGTFDPSETDWQPLLNSADSVVELAPLNPQIPPSVVGDLDGLRAEAVGDTQVPFIGPMSDNEGNQQIASGQRLSDEELDQICWFVDGVVSTETPDGEPEAAEVPSSCLGI